jgi:hypothetical protein
MASGSVTAVSAGSMTLASAALRPSAKGRLAKIGARSKVRLLMGSALLAARVLDSRFVESDITIPFKLEKCASLVASQQTFRLSVAVLTTLPIYQFLDSIAIVAADGYFLLERVIA